MATGEFRLDAARVVSPVTPDKNGSAVELGEFETNNAAILHDPVEIVTGTVAWRPERAETAFTVHIPLPMRAPFVLDVGAATIGFEGPSGTFGHRCVTRQVYASCYANWKSSRVDG